MSIIQFIQNWLTQVPKKQTYVVDRVDFQYNVVFESEPSETISIFRSGRNAHGFAKRLCAKSRRAVRVYKMEYGYDEVDDIEYEDYQ